MWAFDNVMSRRINELQFGLRRLAPKDENNILALVIYRSYHCIRELLPAFLAMRVGFMGPDRQNGV